MLDDWQASRRSCNFRQILLMHKALQHCKQMNLFEGALMVMVKDFVRAVSFLIFISSIKLAKAKRLIDLYELFGGNILIVGIVLSYFVCVLKLVIWQLLPLESTSG